MESHTPPPRPGAPLSPFDPYPLQRPFFTLQLTLDNSYFLQHLSPKIGSCYAAQICILAKSRDLLWQYRMTISVKLQNLRNSKLEETNSEAPSLPSSATNTVIHTPFWSEKICPLLLSFAAEVCIF